MIEKYLIRQALESDEAMKTAAARIYFDSDVKFRGRRAEDISAEMNLTDFLERAQTCAQYAVEYSEYLYDQLNLFLSDTDAWIQSRAEEIHESGQAGEHIAALPYLAHKVHTPGSDVLPNLIEEKRGALCGLSQREIAETLKKFYETAMTGMFAAEEKADVPCLRDDQIARLGVLLGMEAYTRSFDKDDRMFDRVHPNLKLEAMLIWGVATAELRCSASGGKKDRFYAWNLSNMVCAILSGNIDFDAWAHLREAMDSMCEVAPDFYGILQEMTQDLDPQPGRHLLVPGARARDLGGERWIGMLRTMTENTNRDEKTNGSREKGSRNVDA